MTFASGSPTIDFQYGQITPSTTVAAIQVNGNLNFTATPNVIVTNASALGVGTYPLIKYSGTSSGAAPTTATLQPQVIAAAICRTAQRPKRFGW